jgi:hypothetical protein
MAVRKSLLVFWVIMTHGLVGRYQHFEGHTASVLMIALNMEAV